MKNHHFFYLLMQMELRQKRTFELAQHSCRFLSKYRYFERYSESESRYTCTRGISISDCIRYFCTVHILVIIMAVPSKDSCFLPLWQNGPSPGAFYHFPGTQNGTGGFQKSQYVLTIIHKRFSSVCSFLYITCTSLYKSRMSSSLLWNKLTK